MCGAFSLPLCLMNGHIVKTIKICLLKACWHTVFGRFENYHLKKSHSVCIKNQNIQNMKLNSKNRMKCSTFNLRYTPELFFFFTAWNAQSDELAKGSNTWYYYIQTGHRSKALSWATTAGLLTKISTVSWPNTIYQDSQAVLFCKA